MASRIQIRRDTAANWSANNPTLSSGEIAFVTDENKIKVGNGETAWNSLAYLEADAYLNSVVMGDDTTGNYVETLIASDGISISGEGAESASVTVTNTGVLSLAGTTNEIDVSASSGNITLSLPTSITVDLVGDVTGNADTATTLETSRAISLGGDVSGSASFDGGSNITITATVADDSHNHIVSNVDGLQTALDAKAPLESPALTGTPTAPTASASANSTQIATTAFVQTTISNVIDGAPGALDTLNELAAALGDDANFASTVTNSLAEKQPLDSDLTAIAGLSASATGYAKKTGDGTWSVGDVELGTDTSGIYVARLSSSGDGLLVEGSGESASVTISNTGVTSLSGTASEIEVSASTGSVTLSLPSTINANTTGNAATATKLATARAITLTGDATGTANFDGSASAGIAVTLANSGVSASTYGGSTDVPVITVDAKGRITDVTTSAIVSLPSQDGNSGKYLTTNGTTASWADVTLSGYALLTGATFTGEVDVVSASAAGSTSARQITMSTSSPTGGANGDVWLQYS